MEWYGNWGAVIASILFFTLFAAGFAYAPKKRDSIQPTGETGHLIAVALDRLEYCNLIKECFW